MRTFISLGCVVACVAFTSAGCSPSDEAPSEQTGVATNTHCPIMGGKVTAEGGSADWNGQKVGFCCPECIGKWEALSEEDKAKKLVKARDAAKAADGADHAGHEHGKSGA